MKTTNKLTEAAKTLPLSTIKNALKLMHGTELTVETRMVWTALCGEFIARSEVAFDAFFDELEGAA